MECHWWVLITALFLPRLPLSVFEQIDAWSEKIWKKIAKEEEILNKPFLPQKCHLPSET